jgi:inorganic pyrophosphatase
MKNGKGIEQLPPFDEESGDLNVVIETPKGSRNKYTWEADLGLFKLGGVLTAGHSFPYDFGFIPNTKGGDGDPLDVLVLMDEAAFTGCLIRCRVIGVIEAEQTERNGETTRNDRLIAVSSDSHTHEHIRSINDLDKTYIDEIEHFFISYNDARGKAFKPIGRFAAAKAKQLVEQSHAK